MFSNIPPRPTSLKLFCSRSRLSPRQLASFLDVHISTVWRWMRDGVRVGDERVRLKSTRVGGRVFIMEEDASAFLTALKGARDKSVQHQLPESSPGPDERYCEKEGL